MIIESSCAIRIRPRPGSYHSFHLQFLYTCKPAGLIDCILEKRPWKGLMCIESTCAIRIRPRLGSHIPTQSNFYKHGNPPGCEKQITIAIHSISNCYTHTNPQGFVELISKKRPWKDLMCIESSCAIRIRTRLGSYHLFHLQLLYTYKTLRVSLN